MWVLKEVADNTDESVSEIVSIDWKNIVAIYGKIGDANEIFWS